MAGRAQPGGGGGDRQRAPPRRSPPCRRGCGRHSCGRNGSARRPGAGPAPRRSPAARRHRGDAAAGLADIDLDQRLERAGMRGDGAGDLDVVGDDLHRGAGGVQRGDGIQLRRGDADGVDLVAPAGLGEVARLGQGADGDRAEIRARPASPPRRSSRSSCAAAAPGRGSAPPPPASGPGSASARRGRAPGRASAGRRGSSRGAPMRILVDRQDRARQLRPGEAGEDGRGQAGRIDLDDPVGGEELVEAAAEMPARLHHHAARRADIEPEMLEEGGIGALRADGDDDDGDAAEPQRRGGARASSRCRRRCRAGR